VIDETLNREMYQGRYASVFDGDRNWTGLGQAASVSYQWDPKSTYIRRPLFFENMGREPKAVSGFSNAQVLALLGDSITTDHISPAGAIPVDSPAGQYLQAEGVAPGDFNSYGSRRGNHEVMLRGTFANIRLRNQLAPGTEGGWTRYLPTGEQMSIYEAAMRYQSEAVPLLVIAGSEYGTGSSRDWAAKGSLLLGVAAVLAQSYERIHRSNLVGMGVLPLQFQEGDSASSLGLTGQEIYSLEGLNFGVATVKLMLRAGSEDSPRVLDVVVRIDTPMEWEYYRHGGILPFMVRTLAQKAG
jgi:aconitate hydratase